MKNKMTQIKFDYQGLSHAAEALRDLRKNSRIALFTPIILVSIAFGTFHQFMVHWWKDPFIDFIVGVFIIGQFLAVFQHRTFLRGSYKVDSILRALVHGGETGLSGSVAALQKLPSGHLRDLLLRVIVPLQRGDTSLAQNLLDTGANRRSVHEGRRLSQHISLNRTILKLGFLGTLIGLLLTFPPMQSAILSLKNSGGEMTFVTDIAKALDGDNYAIFTTLIATGLSLLIELITIQLVERSFGRFEHMNSHVEEWLLAEASNGVGKDPTEWGQDFKSMQGQIHNNLSDLADMVRKTTRRIDDVREMQEAMERRLERVQDLSKETST